MHSYTRHPLSTSWALTTYSLPCNCSWLTLPGLVVLTVVRGTQRPKPAGGNAGYYQPGVVGRVDNQGQHPDQQQHGQQQHQLLQHQHNQQQPQQHGQDGQDGQDDQFAVVDGVDEFYLEPVAYTKRGFLRTNRGDEDAYLEPDPTQQHGVLPSLAANTT
jgi:hypothetical protein